MYGIEHGGSSGQNVHLKTQDDIANLMDMDTRTLQRYKQLSNMIPELDDLVTTGTVTKTTALATYVALRGYKPNGDRKTECQNGTRLSLDEIAKELNTSKRNLQRALSCLSK